MLFLGIIVSLLIFTGIVLIHEYGHFKAARIFWVKVEEFWIGIPPRAVQLFRDRKWTLFSLNWIPLWWFVRLKWEQGILYKIYSKDKKNLSQKEILDCLKSWKAIFSSDGKEIDDSLRQDIEKEIKKSHESDNLHRKAYWKQAIIILAGVFMNFILSFVIFVVLFFFWVQPLGINDKIETKVQSKLIPTYSQAVESWILKVSSGVLIFPVKDWLSEKQWLKEWDTILSLNWQSISIDNLRLLLLENKEREVELSIKRQETIFSIKVTPNKEGKIESYISENISYNQDFIYRYSFTDSVKFAFIEVYSQSILTLQAMKHLFSKILFPVTDIERQEAVQSLSWPIGISSVITQWISLWISFLLVITALISLNLAIFNLLPIPALDGGRFVFICIHWFFSLFSKKQIFPQTLENIIHVFFFTLLIIMSIFVAYNDILRLFQ